MRAPARRASRTIPLSPSVTNNASTLAGVGRAVKLAVHKALAIDVASPQILPTR
jgi:hypothetical protein